MKRAHVIVSGDPISQARGAQEVFSAIEAELSYLGLQDEVTVSFTGQVDRTDALPIVMVFPEGVCYGPVKPADGAYLVQEHLYKGRIVQHLLAPKETLSGTVVQLPAKEGAIYAQKRVVLRRVGLINPLDIEDYIANDGYFALGKALTSMKPAEVLKTVMDSNLQGRGGAGFPTGLKWNFASQQPGSKYIVCNADESEPGTYKDRLILEGDPHAVLEGMALAGYAVGAHEGWIYIRGEYGMARERLETAIKQAEAYGLLGNHIMGTDFSFHVHVHSGAGAYICGEETALLESLEGKRGIPRIRPPYPTVKGFHGCPTVVNNVETLANVPPIILNGAQWFRSMGTQRCPGTKVYTIMGDVNFSGLIEVPMGITLREVIEHYAGGMKNGKAFKCAQTGGASGSIFSAEFLDTPLDFFSMAQQGLSLGSGALLICDEDTDVVELTYVLMRFFVTESCGKCVPCRVGTVQMLEALERLRKGYARMSDLEHLEQIAFSVKETAFCGLGQAAPVPILTGLRFFRQEFMARVRA